MAMDIQPDNKPDIGLDLPANLKPEGDKPKKEKKGKGGKSFIALLVIIIVLVVAGYLVNQYTSISLFGTSSDDQFKAS